MRGKMNVLAFIFVANLRTLGLPHARCYAHPLTRSLLKRADLRVPQQKVVFVTHKCVDDFARSA